MYDLPDNIIPPGTDKTKPAVSEYARHLIMRSLQCLGIAYLKEIAWNGRFVKPDIKKEIKLLLDEGQVAEVNVEGLKGPLYMLPVYKKEKDHTCRRCIHSFSLRYIECIPPPPARFFLSLITSGMLCAEPKENTVIFRCRLL